MLRRIATVVLALVGGVLALGIAAFAVAQTGPAKDQISGYVADTLSSPQQQAEVQQLGGLLPFDIRIGRLALRDDKGVWLEVNQARVKLSPTSLLKGEVRVEEAGAERVAVDHLPPASPKQPSTTPFRLPELPKLPEKLPVAALDRLHVDRIEVGAAVLGQAAVFSLEGQATTGLEGKTPSATLSLRRTDQPTASLNLVANADLGAPNLGIKLDGSETGGLMAALTKQPQAGALSLLLEGNGPLDDWRGHLTADVEHLARLETGLDLAYASTHRIGIDGTFTAAPGALPASIAPVLGDRATLALHGGETTPGLFTLDQLSLKAGALSLDGKGQADLNADRLDGQATLQLPSLGPFSGLAGTPLDGRVQLTLNAAGRVAEPALHLGLDGEGITAQRVAVAKLGGGYDVTLLRSAEGTIAGARVAGAATVDGLAVEGREVGEGGKASLELQASVPPQGQVELQKVSLASGLARLDLTGALDRASLEGSLKLSGAVPELATILALLPPETASGLPPLKGALALDGTATLGPQADRINADLALTGQNLAGLPPGAQELLGASPRLAAKGTVEHKAAVSLDSLQLAGAGVTVSGNPSLGLDRALGGRIAVELPDLAKLAAVAKQPLGGRANLTADLAGTLDAPAVTLSGSGEALSFAGQTVDRLGLTGRIAGPTTTPAGDLRLTAARGGQELALAADYALENRDRLRLPRLELTGPQTRLAGDLDLDLKRLVASGRLSGNVGDLGALSAWTQQQGLVGAVDIEAVLTVPEGRQDATLKAGVKGVAGGFGHIDQANLDASLRDARGKGSLDGTLGLGGFTRPDLEVKQASLTAKGPLDRLDLKATAAGTQAAQPFDLRADAQVAALGESKSVLLQSLGGKLAGQTLQLMSPARLALDKGVLDLDQLDLKVGPAQVQGSLRYGNGQAKGEVRLAALPLDLLRGFGGPALQGTAQGRVQLAGSPAAPRARLDLALSHVQPGGADRATPAVDLQLTATAAEGRLSTDLTAKGLGQAPLTATAALPVRFSLQPASFAVQRDAPLSGQLRGRVDLARVAAFAALDRQSVGGGLDADLTLAGTLAAPALQGAVTMQDGRFDELTSGASLRNIKLDARAQGRRIELSDLSASDPHGGRIAGHGSVAFDAALRPDFELALSLARARLLDGDLGIAVISGEAEVKGDAQGAKADARLRVDEADLRIPEGGGVDIPQLQVQQKGQPAAGPAKPVRPAYPVGLDVALDAPSRLFVRGRGLESEWGGGIKVAGELPSPEVSGQIRFRRGFLDLLNQRFTIRQGTVSFAGQQPPIPVVDIEADTSAAEVQAVVKLQGPANDPKLTLTSRPQLPQDEVLSRVLFKRATDRITPIQGIQLAAAVRQLQGGSGGLNGVLASLRKAAGVDTLDIQGGETAADSSASVGKYINDRVYLQLQRGVQPGSGKARVEVELTPNLSVGTDVTEQSQTGVDLQWRYDY